MKIIEMNSEKKKLMGRHLPNNIIKWGSNNLFPDDILYLYWNSPTLQGILNRKTKLTAGQTYTFSNPDAEFFAKDIHFQKLFNKCILDFYLYNCFSLQIITKTFENKIADVKYQDTSLIRLDDNISKINLSSNWASSKQPIIIVDRFYMDQELKDGFYFYTQEMPGLCSYPNPSWYSGWSSIEGEINTIQVSANLVKNSFMPSGIMTVPRGMSDEEWDLVERDIKGMTGPSETAKILTIEVDNEKQMTWTPLSNPLEASGVQGFLDMWRQNIIIANSLTSPTIIGLPGGASIGGDGGTIETAYKTYFDNELLPVQNTVKNIFEEIFLLAGYPTEITIENGINNNI